jgi:hypothetical protein
MDYKVNYGGKEHLLNNLGDQSKENLAKLNFITTRLRELNNMQALLQCAKNSYIQSLKQEILSSKSGLQLNIE